MLEIFHLKCIAHNLSLNHSNPLNISFYLPDTTDTMQTQNIQSPYFQVQNTRVAVMQHIRSILIHKKKLAYDVEIEKLGNLESTKYTVACCCPHKANIRQSSKRPPTLSRFDRKILASGLHQKHLRILNPKGVLKQQD